jgi:hypothetical protein
MDPGTGTNPGFRVLLGTKRMMPGPTVLTLIQQLGAARLKENVRTRRPTPLFFSS